MRTLKSIISLLLVLALLTACLSSCDIIGKDPEKLVAEAEEALKDKTYTIDLVIKYSSEQEGMKDAIDAFTSPKIKTEVRGDAFRIAMSFEKDGLDNGVTHTYVDGKLYTELSDTGINTNTVTELDEADRLELTEKLGAGAAIGIDDFSEVSAKSLGGVSVITCTEIKDEALDVLVKDLEERLDALDAFVAIKNVTLAIQITDGLYELTLLTCEYNVMIAEEVYTLTMTYASKFTYGDVAEITAPDFN